MLLRLKYISNKWQISYICFSPNLWIFMVLNDENNAISTYNDINKLRIMWYWTTIQNNEWYLNICLSMSWRHNEITKFAYICCIFAVFSWFRYVVSSYSNIYSINSRYIVALAIVHDVLFGDLVITEKLEFSVLSL